MSNPILYIVVPCYNEEEALPLSAPVFLDKLLSLCPEGRVVLVDDGSGDDTWSIIQTLHGSDPHFSGLRLRENRGHQNALTAGLMWSRFRADAAISIDADLQDDINAMDEMWTKYLSGCDVVCGVRHSRDSDSFWKRTTARGYYALMKILGSDLIYDHADYRLMNKDALKRLSHYREDDLFLRGLVKRVGHTVGLVYYDRRAREAGESKYTLKKMLKLAMKGFTCGRLKPQKEPRGEMDPFIGEVLHCEEL